ncbi:isocitrate dehydrogenase [NAD] subunit gamma, mitochondrial [Mauremys reevesii]|uniref:isocitrate dehydrogenase [NAD] subunit gamma, mitochondrial n=1 Tax=Mauremys reevesii TaxID=260615 RepID=UPI00193F0C16|nr:isocitrate dehydrogenase [NAD] subunit gamma, mitochondrial [Mauremys reevesii]
MAAALMATRQLWRAALLAPRLVPGAERRTLTSHTPIPPPAKYGGRHTVTMIPGDGIGPELMLHVKEVFRQACVPVDFEEVRVSSEAAEDDIQNAIMAIRRNRVALKGNIETNHNLPPSHKSRNNILRTSRDLYANVIHCQSLPRVLTRHRDIDILIVRENTEGEYSSLEHEEAGRRALPAVLPGGGGRLPGAHLREHDRGQHHHAAGVPPPAVRRHGDAQSLREHREQRVRGAGRGPGAGARRQLREGLRRLRDRHADHGKSIAQKNVANPTATLLAACMMLDHLRLHSFATTIRQAVLASLDDEATHTPDIGGQGTTSGAVQSILRHVRSASGWSQCS